MKFSIGYRFFTAILLSVILTASVAIVLMRWTFFDYFSEVPAGVESQGLGDLIDTISTQYRSHYDWSFLPAAPAARKKWLREEFGLLQQNNAKFGQQSLSQSIGYRIGLLDKDKHYLAGVIASPVIIAFASVDTTHQPINVDGKIIGYLVVAKPQNPADELAIAFLIEQQRNIVAVGVIGILLSVLMSLLLAAHFRKPIRQLLEGARLLENSQFDTRLNIGRHDELGELTDAFNHLAARLQEAEQSRQQWVADTSHELRTPLSVLRAQMESMLDGVRNSTPENIAIMHRQVLSLTKLVDELHDFTRADIGQFQYNMSRCDFWRLIGGVVDEFSGKFDEAGLSVKIGTSTTRSNVICDPDRMRQVIANLLENCTRYTATGGKIEVHSALVDDQLQIVIQDSAPSVPASSLARLGERFFRVESSRSRQLGGTGLGLAMCKQIVAAHKGRLKFEPSPLGGLRVTVLLKLED